jgi:aryl-alcohol dehydrogenase-like predicted oxidoreductase
VTTFAPRLLPVLNKRAFPLGLACNYGIDSEGVREAADAGVNYFFWPGMRCKPALEGVREVLAGDRERYILAAGTGGPFGFHYRARVEAILKQLEIDYIDVFQMFWLGVTAFDTRGVMDALLRLRDEGKIRAIGVTIHDRQRAGRLVADSELDMLQVRYNAAHPGAEEEIFPHLPARRRFLVAYTATSWRQLLQAPDGWTGRVPDAADCYRFALSHPAVSVALTGPASTAQLLENLEGLDRGPMGERELAWIREFGDLIHHPVGRPRWRSRAGDASPEEHLADMVARSLDDHGAHLRALDFAVRRYDGGDLEIVGGHDEHLHTHPEVLLRFRGVSYVDCPTAFRHAALRVASLDERHAIERRAAIDGGAVVYAVEGEVIGSVERHPSFIVARDVELLVKGDV